MAGCDSGVTRMMAKNTDYCSINLTVAPPTMMGDNHWIWRSEAMSVYMFNLLLYNAVSRLLTTRSASNLQIGRVQGKEIY